MLAYRAGDLGVAAEAMARRRRLGFPDPKFDTDRLMAADPNIEGIQWSKSKGSSDIYQ